MAAAKFAVGIAIGSLALISEALHSSVDVVATVITWLVVRVSDQPADEEHHYGHGKFESLSALVRHRAALRAGRRHPGRDPGAACATAPRRRRSRRSRSWCW
jgi:predicted Co/Zn/Cd cation transporter (cation efflux family)